MATPTPRKPSLLSDVACVLLAVTCLVAFAFVGYLAGWWPGLDGSSLPFLS